MQILVTDVEKNEAEKSSGVKDCYLNKVDRRGFTEQKSEGEEGSHHVVM